MMMIYSLRLKILVGGMDVSRRILVLGTSIFMHFSDNYFRTEGVYVSTPCSYFIGLGGRMVFKKEGFGDFLQAYGSK